MKTLTLSMLAVLAIAKPEESLVEKEEEWCVCCRRLSEMDHELRMLCLPPPDDEAEVIEELCNPEEDIDECIARFEADENADQASLNDLKVIRENQEEREAEHDHDHSHEGESGAVRMLSAAATLTAALALALF